ncbi:MAG: AAA family ATPase [Gammaproteobacteria bacterium]|nr:AAA family ATPase [Gammaproteobacteria bacterium]
MNNPQHDPVTAQWSLLAALMVIGRPTNEVERAIGKVTLDALTTPNYRAIYSAILTLRSAGKGFDLVAVDAELTRLQAGIDFATLATMAKELISTAPLLSWADVIAERHSLRSIERALRRGNAILADEGTPAEKLERIKGELASAVRAGDNQTSRDGVDVLRDFVAELEESLRNPERYMVPTGIAGLDVLMDGGLNKNDLLVIGARPKMGKTELMTQIAGNIAFDQRKPVLLFSMEMSGKQIMARITAQRAAIDKASYRKGLETHEFAALSRFMGEIQRGQLALVDRPRRSLGDICTEARELAFRYGQLGAICVDYLTLMHIDTKNNRYDLGVAEVTAGLKSLATELQAPVILLAQLNRNLEQRANKRPVMSDLRESGSIEQDADRIVFLYREAVYDPQTPLGNITEIILAASRHSGTGTVYADLTNHGFSEVASDQVRRLNASAKRPGNGSVTFGDIS